jgi:hypothetical protein
MVGGQSFSNLRDSFFGPALRRKRPTSNGRGGSQKHAVSAMSPLKSWLVEKPQPNRKMLQAMLVAVFAAVLLATRLPSR